MPFHKFACDGGYATGAIRTTLDPRGLAFKLTRHNIPTRVYGPCVDASCNADRWTFNEVERDKDGGYVVWLQFTMTGDLEAFSRRLATHGVRHRFEWSESKDGINDRIRRVTRYSYRWNGLDRTNAARTTPDIEEFEEHL
jgi:hypothetical protein